MIEFPEGLQPEGDLSPARWVQTALEERPSEGSRIRHHVPPIFEAYARILHHPTRPTDVREPTGTWRERAIELGLQLRSDTSWVDLTRDGDRWWLHPGSLSEPELESLVRAIGARVAGGHAWFAVWIGVLPPHRGVLLRARNMGPFTEWWARRMGWARMRREERALDRLPTFEIHGSDAYVLLRGTPQDAVRLFHSLHFQSPHLWWSDDRGWFVHTGDERTSSYLGGPRALIEGVVADGSIEAFEVGVDDRMMF